MEQPRLARNPRVSWRTEMSQYRAQQMQYKKSPEEWEILGELSERLHYDREAVEAYQQCLGLRFSPRAMRGVMMAWQKEGDVRGVVGAVIRLVCWQYRWYSEVSFLLTLCPSGLCAHSLRPPPSHA